MTKPILTYLGVALLGAAVGAGGMAIGASERGTPDRSAMEATIHDYLLAHPEVIPEAMQRLQDRQTADALDTHRAAIETPFAGAVAGNPKGDVTLVEYFDYDCVFCRASVGDVDRLIASDPKLRVVFHELPVLTEQSAPAARASLAAAKAGKFLAFHHALYKQGTLTPEKIAAVEQAVGIAPLPAKTPAIDAQIDTNLQVARAVGFSGTPTFVVGDKILNGAVGYDALKAAIASARAEQG